MYKSFFKKSNRNIFIPHPKHNVKLGVFELRAKHSLSNQLLITVPSDHFRFEVNGHDYCWFALELQLAHQIDMLTARVDEAPEGKT